MPLEVIIAWVMIQTLVLKIVLYYSVRQMMMLKWQ